ncbi:MAG TPA: hypothetical protein VEW69_06355 [Alphaproteobacteria bacterium]|nr:hypothetical protein [Alphaproteobacteria bacterium]
MADHEIVIDIKAEVADIKEHFDELKEGFEKAKEASKAFSEMVNGEVKTSLEGAQVQAEATGAAVEAAFSPAALIGFFTLVAQATEKLTQFISDTFIYTDAEKKAVAQISEENKEILKLADHTKQLTRERELLEATSDSAREKLKLQFQIEDRGGSAQELRDRLKAIGDQMVGLSQKSRETEKVLSGGFESAAIEVEQLTDDAEKAKKTIEGLQAEQILLPGKIKEAEAAEAVEKTKIHQDEVREAKERERQKEQAMMQGFQQELDGMRMVKDVGKQQELEFWQNKLDQVKEGTALYNQIYHTIAMEMQAVRAEVKRQDEAAERKNVQDVVDSVRSQLVTEKSGSEKRVQILENGLTALEELGKQDTKAYKQMVDQKIKAEQDLAKAKQAAADKAEKLAHDINKVELSEAQDHAKAVRDLATQEADFKLQIGKITAEQHYQLSKQAMDKEYQEQKKTLEKEMQDLIAAHKKETVEYANLHKQLIKIQDEFNKNSAKLTDKWVAEQRQKYQQFFNQFNSQFNTALNGMMQGTETASQAFSKMFQSILSQLVTFVEQWIEKKIEMWIMDKLVSTDKAESNISTTAGETYAYAFSDSASLGPEGLAAAPGVAMGAVTAMLGGAHSLMAAKAEGGQYLVPGNQLTMLHAQEMVLPAGIASRMRDVVENGGSGGGGVTVVVNHSVNAVDAESFQGVMRKHSNIIGQEVARVLKKKGMAVK